MRFRAIIVIMFCLVTVFLAERSFADNSELHAKQLFAQAAEAYKKGDYETSVRLNSEVLASGFESGAVHYNLGNSYLRSRQLGRALASYLRAQRLSPGDVDVLANLSYARGVVALQTPEKRPVYWLRPFEWFSLNELRWVLLGAFIFTASLVLFALYAGWKTGRIVFWTLVGGMICVYCLAGTFYRAAEDALQAVCIEKVDVKFEPSEQATTYFKLPEGSEVRVLREKDGWSKIERPDGKVGWALSAAVERI